MYSAQTQMHLGSHSAHSKLLPTACAHTAHFGKALNDKPAALLISVKLTGAHAAVTFALPVSSAFASLSDQHWNRFTKRRSSAARFPFTHLGTGIYHE